jgi:hypothetical protein
MSTAKGAPRESAKKDRPWLRRSASAAMATLRGSKPLRRSEEEDGSKSRNTKTLCTVRKGP